MATPPKIHLYSLTELKTTLDDHLPLYLSTATTPSNQPLPRQKRFTPSHTLTYVRLALGYTAVAIALYIFYLDYVLKIKFTDIKGRTAAAVGAYFALNGALTLWLLFGERGLVFAGSREDGREIVQIEVRSKPPHRKYSPTYRLEVSWSSSGNASLNGTKEVKAEFMQFFSQDGQFQAAPFESWMREVVPAIIGSAADMGRAAVGGEGAADSSATKTLWQEGHVSHDVGGDTVTVGSSNNTESPRKRGRPRKSEVK